MIKIPHWTIICIAIGAFLLPIVGGYPSLDGQRILAADNLFVAAIAGEKSPFLTHFLVSLLFFVPICATLFAKKISHVVNLRISLWLAVLGACVGASVISTSFPSVTVGVILEWAMMSLAFFAVTLCCGRKQSAIPILSFLAGSTFAAILGILEFGQARLFDPTYRISALQIGPNQAGALFAAGTVLCLAMSLRFERIGKLALILSAILQCFAMVLTQSKGAFVCLPLGLLVLFVAIWALKSVKPTVALAGIMIPILITGGLAVVMQKGVAKQSGQQAMSRVFNSNAEANQSAGFRKLLWSSAIELAEKRPMGWGMGTFWYESTRPGKVTQTALAHQTFLQLACEASPVAPVALFGFLAAVVIWGLRGIKTQTADSQILLVGILGTLVVAIAHNFVDSDMYVFGLGSLVFLLCGSFVASSSDSQAPEFIFALPKIIFGATAVILLPICFAMGMSEFYRAIARGAVYERDKGLVIQASSSAISFNFLDGQAYAQRALATLAEEDLIAATKYHPSPKAFRALADHYAENKKYQESFKALGSALERDPNNAPALLKYMEEAFQAGDIELGNSKARLLIATENSEYFKVRSQPEFIPTETYIARIFLSKTAGDPKERAKLLIEAIKGLSLYREKTGTVVMRAIGDDPNASLGGIDRKTLADNYKLGQEACADLVNLQGLEATKPDFNLPEEAAKFAAALGALNK